MHNFMYSDQITILCYLYNVVQLRIVLIFAENLATTTSNLKLQKKMLPPIAVYSKLFLREHAFSYTCAYTSNFSKKQTDINKQKKIIAQKHGICYFL